MVRGLAGGVLCYQPHCDPDRLGDPGHIRFTASYLGAKIAPARKHPDPSVQRAPLVPVVTVRGRRCSINGWMAGGTDCTDGSDDLIGQGDRHAAEWERQ